MRARSSFVFAVVLALGCISSAASPVRADERVAPSHVGLGLSAGQYQGEPSTNDHVFGLVRVDAGRRIDVDGHFELGGGVLFGKVAAPPDTLEPSRPPITWREWGDASR